MGTLPRLRCLSLLQRVQTSIDQLKQIHAQIIINGFNSHPATSVLGKLIDRYCAVPSPDGLDYARLIFKHTNDPNVFTWNVMIRCMPPGEAILIFSNGVAREDMVFDNFTYIFVVGACARSLAFWEGRQIHARIFKTGFASDVSVQTTSIHFYTRSKDISSARLLFDEMPERSSATWNAMITGYCSQRTRINDYAHDAFMLFRAMLVDNFAVKPTDTTMVGVLSATSQLGVLETAICVHGYIQKTIYIPEDDVFIGTGLVDMYSKCGCLSSASWVFKRMKKKNVLTWTAMATGLAIHGQGKEALELLGAMVVDNIKPNSVTFTSLLCACCHTGLVEEGFHLFNSMRSKFGVTPQIQHYGCIVDLLGRAGRLEEAYEFIIRMPVEPDTILWRSLLNSCNVHGDVGMGEKVGKLLLRLRPEQGSVDSTSICEDYIALSNIFATAQRWEDVELVRGMMKVKGIPTKPGYSSVQSVSHHQLYDGL